ncbi:MAG: HPr family phosphocarrier protein [Desulfosudaceae bacterium]
MGNSSNRFTKELTVTNELGLHARAAAQVAQLAGRANNVVWLQNGGTQVDASSVIDILSLACVKGSKITFVAEDHADKDILEELTQLVEAGFGE